MISKKKHNKTIKNCALIVCLVISLSMIQGTYSKADKMSELKSQLAQTQGELNKIARQEANLEGKKDAVEEEIAELDTNLIQLMSSIEILGEAIAAKQVEVEQATRALQDAMERERAQYEAMKIRIRFMYEKGEYNYVQLLLEARDISELMNKADYIERLYTYDRKLLLDYQEIVREVGILKDKLEEEKAALQAEEFELQEEQAALEELLSQKRAEADDYDAQISSLRSISSQYIALVRQQTNQIKQLEAEEAARREAERKAREEAERRAREEAEKKKQSESGTTATEGTSGQSSSSGSSSGSTSGSDAKAEAKSQAASNVSSSSGSAKGKDIASFACNFIGNPYVPGGTSLTNGADCSGFTQSVFKNYGISLPRNSASQRSAGKSIPYSEAQPGDLICYPGHVAIYIGNGQIVHASTQKSGIKTSPATYRDILDVRRVT